MNKQELTQSEQKKLVGITAIDMLIKKGLIYSGVKIGLGTGSTAKYAVIRLAELLHSRKIADIKAVTTSAQTSALCEEYEIPVYTLNSKAINGELDIAIDGADEIDDNNYLIKGGGAAHVQEKIVEYNAKKLVIIADSSKKVQDLGTAFPLPVEIIPVARRPITKALEKLGAHCIIRECEGKDGPLVTDNGNYILDCTWQKNVQGKSPIDPAHMEVVINAITGVVENGFFTQKRPLVFFAHADGSVREIE